MKIFARQLTIDLYNCDVKQLEKIDEIKNLFRIAGEEPNLVSDVIDENHAAIVGAFDEGHVALHVYRELRYVAVDIFTCATDDDEPENIAKELRKFFRPDKTKSTFLKRGDFGQSKDIKPKIKTRVAPLRKVKNAGAKVVKKLRGDDK